MNIRFLLALAMVGSSPNLNAKITYEDAIEHDKQMSEENSHIKLEHGFTNAELAMQTSGGGGEASFYTISGGHNRTEESFSTGIQSPLRTVYDRKQFR